MPAASEAGAPRTVLLRLAGPLQSWGTHSLFERRDTGAHPTASGVIGLIRCALGVRREIPLGPLAHAEVAVRIDQPGTILRDYQTVGTGGYRSANGKVTAGEPKLSVRFYLQDAVFTAAVGNLPPALAERIDQALGRPHWPLCLGRRSCPPAEPVRLGVSALPPAAALTALPYQGYRARPPACLTLLVTATDGNGESVADVPLDYAERRFGSRALRTLTVPGLPRAATATTADPDPDDA